MAHIKFGNVDFSTEEMFIFSGGAYSAPVRDVTREAVLGRNGDVIVDNGRYMNTTASFVVNVQGDVPRNIERLKYMLYSQKGYQRLYDSTAKDFYRMACFTDGFELTNADGGNILLTFNCKPHKYAISGDEWIDAKNAKFVNPFFENANPIIKIGGEAGKSGSITIKNDVEETKISFQTAGYILYIDTSTQQAWTQVGDMKYNAAHLVDAAYAEFKKGVNFVYCDGDFSVQIQPRWCTI